MNSTRRAGASWTRGWLWALALMPLAVACAPAAEQAMPYPPQLQRDVNFWVRVYTQIDTNSGYLHDQYNLAVVYDTLHFAPYSSPRARQRIVNQARDHYAAELRRIASGQQPLSPEDQRIKALWGPQATPGEAARGDRRHPLPAGAGESLQGRAHPLRRVAAGHRRGAEG